MLAIVVFAELALFVDYILSPFGSKFCIPFYRRYGRLKQLCRSGRELTIQDKLDNESLADLCEFIKVPYTETDCRSIYPRLFVLTGRGCQARSQTCSPQIHSSTKHMPRWPLDVVGLQLPSAPETIAVKDDGNQSPGASGGLPLYCIADMSPP